jgi:hypothetical protein
MPYDSVADAVKKHPNLKKYSAKAQRAFVSAFNSAHESGKDEGSCFAIGYSAANKVDGKTSSVPFDDRSQHDILHQLRDDPEWSEVTMRNAPWKSVKKAVAKEVLRVARLLAGYTVFSPETLARDLPRLLKRELATDDYDPFTDDTLDVDGRMVGKYYPATRWEPAEYPELDELTTSEKYVDLSFDVNLLSEIGFKTTPEALSKAFPLLSRALMGDELEFWAWTSMKCNMQFGGKVSHVTQTPKGFTLRLTGLYVTDHRKNTEGAEEYLSNQEPDFDPPDDYDDDRFDSRYDRHNY